MFDKNFIVHKKNAFSLETCLNAINFFEKRIDLQTIGRANDTINFKLKKCLEIYLKRNEYTLFEDSLQKYLKEYIKLYPFINSLDKWDLSPTFKIQKYNPNEAYFITHCENTSKKDCDRVLTWMIYLNDVKNGGHTCFPYQRKKYQPRTGSLLIWPAHFTHPHKGLPSKTEIKYIATGWTSFTE